MKNNVIALSLMVISVILVSCNPNENEVVDAGTATRNVTPFKSASEMQDNAAQKVKGASAGFVFTLGRQSRNCFGFGVCEMVAFWIDIYTKEFDEQPNYCGIDVDANGNYYGTIELDAPLDPLADSTLYIDNDLYVGSKFTVEAGQYKVQPAVGTYGGYIIEITKN